MHTILATMEPLTQWKMSIEVTDLICNSESYNVKENKIIYFVDSVTKEETPKM